MHIKLCSLLLIALSSPLYTRAMRTKPITSNRTRVITSDGIEHIIRTDLLRGCNVFSEGILEDADLQHQPVYIPLPSINNDLWLPFQQCLGLEYAARTARKRRRKKKALVTLEKKLKKKKTLHKVLTTANYLDHPSLHNLSTSWWSVLEFNATKGYTLDPHVEHEIALKILRSTTFFYDLSQWIARGISLRAKRFKYNRKTPLWACCSNSTNSIIATGDGKGRVSIWLYAQEPSLFFQAHAEHITDMHFSPDDSQLITVAQDSTIKCWDTANGFALSHTFTTQNTRPFAITLNPQGNLLATDRFGGVDIWQLATRTKQTTLNVPNHYKISYVLAFSHDGSLLAIDSDQSTVKILDIKNQTLKLTIPNLLSETTRIAFNHNDTLLAIGTRRGLLCLYNLAKSCVLMAAQEHTDIIWGVVFSPDGRFVCTASSDKTILIWDVITKRRLKKIKTDYRINDMRLTTNNTLITVGDNNFDQWPLNRFLERYAHEKEHIERHITIPQAKLIKRALELPPNHVIDLQTGTYKKAFLGFTAIMQRVLQRELPINAPKKTHKKKKQKKEEYT